MLLNMSALRSSARRPGLGCMRPEGDDVRCETARPLFERVEAPPPIGASDGLPYPMPFLSHIGGAGSIFQPSAVAM